MAIGSVLRRAPRRGLAILGFHNITPTFSQPFLSPDFPRRFRKLCRLVRRRYDVVTVTEGLRRLAAEKEPARPLLALIFDDGYADMHGTILPIMRDEGVVGTSYAIVDCLETGRVPWYEELGRILYRTKKTRVVIELDGREEVFALAAEPRERVDVFWDVTRRIKAAFPDDIEAFMADLARAHDISPHDPAAEPLMLDTRRARELIDAGCEIGCHSRTHPILPTLSEDALHDEIVTAGTRLAELLGRPVTTFCYPNGDNDDRCLRKAREAGYEGAVSMQAGANLPATMNPHRLKRAWMTENITWLWPYHTTYRVHAALTEEP